MPETTKRCQVKMIGGKPCGRELYDDECCIFHSNKEDKDVELFQKTLDGILRTLSVEAHDLTRFVFLKRVVFLKKFSKPVTFREAIFKGDADFSNVVFEGEADFENVKFQRKAIFSHASFEDEVSFLDAVFQGGAEFLLTQFKAEGNLSGAIFKGRAHFEGAVFEGKANFTSATFKDHADLRGTFQAGTYLAGAIFEGTANFRHATFRDVLWINAELRGKRAFHRGASFSFAEFSKPEKVEFRKVDLSRISFLETDVRKVHFSDVDWYRKNGKGRNGVFDEVSPDPYTKKFDYALIAQLYRRLRANYEENLQYSEAGDFYIGEMEMRRKAETNIFKKLPLLFYKAISNYGESYYRPLCWIAAILLIFPLLFMFVGIQPVSLDLSNPAGEVINFRLDFSSIESFMPKGEKIEDYWTSFLYTMSVFSFIRDKKYTTIDNLGRSLFVLESILSPVTLAFFLLALRRRFKR